MGQKIRVQGEVCNLWLSPKGTCKARALSGVLPGCLRYWQASHGLENGAQLEAASGLAPGIRQAEA